MSVRRVGSSGIVGSMNDAERPLPEPAVNESREVRQRQAQLPLESSSKAGNPEEDSQQVQADAPPDGWDPEEDLRSSAAAEGSPPPAAGRSRRGSPGGMPDLILIDGGKGQLNAALAQLRKLGLGSIPIVGLAKEFEEIYRPGVSEPLLLGLDSPAVKLLQRVRDESHRVANGYNAQLRLRKISESVLDEFPGIGEARKAALLKKFGSVQRLRLATVEELAEIPGFGGKAAADLKAFLLARQG